MGSTDSMSTAMAPVVDNTVPHYQTDQVAHSSMQQPQANAVALDDSYADESYDYGQYGDGYDDGSGMIDPNTGMPMQGAGADGNKDRLELDRKLVIEDKIISMGFNNGFQCSDC